MKMETNNNNSKVSFESAAQGVYYNDLKLETPPKPDFKT